MLRCVIRADASPVIGHGHVVRCAALGEVLRSESAAVTFLTRTTAGDRSDWLRAFGFDVVHLPLMNDDIAGEEGEDPDARATVEALRRMGGCDWLIVDHYELTARWERQVRQCAGALLAFDDLRARTHDCELVVDPNLDVEADGRPAVVHAGAVLSGPEFVPLRSEFRMLRPGAPRIGGRARRVCVSFGGGDCRGLTLMALQALAASSRPFVVDVVVGAGNPHRVAIESFVATHRDLTLHVDPPSYPSILARADMAVGGYGGSVWERCCLGIPSWLVSMADNQVAVARELDRRGIVRWIGHWTALGPAAMRRAMQEADDAEALTRMARLAWSLVDGRGASRIADRMAAADRAARTA